MSREQLTENFYRDEFACNDGKCEYCGGAAPMAMLLVDGVQLLRNKLKAAGYAHVIVVSSGYRCLLYNMAIGSNDKSQHPKGCAADIHVKGVPIYIMLEFALEIPQFENGGIGVYEWGLHLDTRGHRARWEG